MSSIIGGFVTRHVKQFKADVSQRNHYPPHVQHSRAELVELLAVKAEKKAKEDQEQKTGSSHLRICKWLGIRVQPHQRSGLTVPGPARKSCKGAQWREQVKVEDSPC